jgi:hypothetical protein
MFGYPLQGVSRHSNLVYFILEHFRIPQELTEAGFRWNMRAITRLRPKVDQLPWISAPDAWFWNPPTGKQIRST